MCVFQCHVSARLFASFRWPINTCLRMVIFEAPGNAVLGVAWPLPSNSGLASFHAVHGEHYRLSSVAATPLRYWQLKGRG